MIENNKKMGYCRRRGGSATGGVMPRLNGRAFVPRRRAGVIPRLNGRAFVPRRQAGVCPTAEQAGVCPAAAAIITEVVYYKGSVTK